MNFSNALIATTKIGFSINNENIIRSTSMINCFSVSAKLETGTWYEECSIQICFVYKFYRIMSFLLHVLCSLCPVKSNFCFIQLSHISRLSLIRQGPSLWWLNLFEKLHKSYTRPPIYHACREAEKCREKKMLIDEALLCTLYSPK